MTGLRSHSQLLAEAGLGLKLSSRFYSLMVEFISESKKNQPRQHIKNQRHYFANKGPSSESYGFSSSHVWM